MADNQSNKTGIKHIDEVVHVRTVNRQEPRGGDAAAVDVESRPSHFAELSVDEGTKIGPYILGAKLGQGGMGSVFVADQLGPVQRRVAFKVIQLGMDN